MIDIFYRICMLFQIDSILKKTLIAVFCATIGVARMWEGFEE